MSSRDTSKQQSADSADTDRSSLPLWDGTHLTGLPWLRELEANEHLLDADVSYFLRTAAVVTSAAKVAVSSPEHSLLLKNNIIVKQNYSIRNPPPDDGFQELYSDIQDKISANEAPFSGEAIKKALPKEVPAALPESHVLSPDRIMVTDLKLRNVILSLITSRGRKIHYQQLTQSGITLLHQLIEDTQPKAGYYTQSPYTLQLKSQLSQLMKINLTCPSQVEFDQIRDSIDEVNNQLKQDDRLTDNQLCDHYMKLISRLKSTPLWLSLQVELRSDGVMYGDISKTVTCITRVLTTFISHEQNLADESGNNTGRALPSMDTDKGPNKDPELVLQALSCTEPPNVDLLRRYQSLVGSLLYAATNTRPDIAYAVGMLCRAMGKPTPDLFEAALRVVAYLHHHRHVGLRYECDQRPLSGMSVLSALNIFIFLPLYMISHFTPLHDFT